ncbi:MAG: hypothetical protein Tsb009_28090 [Planctomycetaceae bacterium]
MHVVFAASAIALMGVTFWMIGADHSEEWHDHQRTFERIQKLRLEKQRRQLQSDEFQKDIAQLEADVTKAQEKLESQSEEYEEALAELKKAQLELSLKEKELKLQRAILGVARANYDLAVRDDKPQETLDRLKAIYDREEAKVEELILAVEKLTENQAKAERAVKAFTAELDEAKKKLKERRKEVDQLQKALEKLQGRDRFSRFKRKIMEWPIIDGFNSHLKIHQDWLPELHIKLGMSSTQRFDRCRTCHVGIDQAEAGNLPSYPHGQAKSNTVEGWVAENKFPHPYSSHPNLDLYLSASSPHPTSKFGCTICHDGNGSGTKFQYSEHGPDNAHQASQWEKKYGYHPNHFWEYPMHPKRFVESGCIKCHHQVEELGNHPKYKKSAPKVYEGYRTIQKYGCFGCHEIHGFEGDKSIGPDLRLEPPYTEGAKQLLHDPLLRKFKAGDSANSQSGISLEELTNLLREIIAHPEESQQERGDLIQLLSKDLAAKNKAEKAILAKTVEPAEIKTQLRKLEARFLSANSHGLIDLFKDVLHPGKYRKVGPSLRHVREKTTRDFIRFWTEKPSRFRPSTRMPQFFDLTNQQDAHAANLTPVEIAAIAQYLYDKSQPITLLTPPKGYQPDPKRGKKSFEQRGCVACHIRKDVEGSSNNFGPDLSRIAEKIKRDPDNPNFSRWLYTWIREPERYHARTKMPNLYLDPVIKSVNGAPPTVVEDPAADITAYLLQGKATYASEKPDQVNDNHLNELVELYLKKVLTKDQRGEWNNANSDSGFFGTRQYPITNLKQIKGDEIELALGTRDGRPDDAEWKRVRLNYVGRRTISRYGCYACHDIPGFEKSRPIGATLQDWGRKDTSKLALEHIEEYLHHHGEADGSSTRKRAELALKQAAADDFPNEETKQSELAVTFFYQSLLHHGRPGFIWQKLRQPRSYDYKKVSTKGFDERLRMPKFPFNEKQIEQVATFVLGLVAEPPPVKYQYKPTGPAYDRFEGERLLKKYNCVSCHMVELPKVTYWATHERPPFYIGDNQAKIKEQQEKSVLGMELLNHMMPARPVSTKMTRTGKDEEGEDVTQSRISFRGLPVFAPNEDPEDPDEPYRYLYNSWEHLDIDGLKIPPSPNLIPVPLKDIEELNPGRGGTFAEWLYGNLKKQERMLGPKEANIARHKIPPVLWREGRKVQTPWLYQFLKNPGKIRQMTVLRMPKFNLSERDARILANYFAAVDEVPYPYQQVPQRNPEYIERKNQELGFPKPGQKHSDYLSQSWKLLNDKNLCLVCHSVGGLAAQQAEGKKDAIRGPNLEYAADRLRPDWTLLWLADPRWITPYTQMPVNFDLGKANPQEPFKGRGPIPWKAVRDALMNYHRLMEIHKKTEFQYPKPKKTSGIFRRRKLTVKNSPG